MENKIFCLQQEKNADIFRLQDQLTGALIGLVHAADTNSPTQSTHRVVVEGLFTTAANLNFREETILQMIETVHREKDRLAPGCSTCCCPCGRTADYDMEKLWNDSEDIRSLKLLLLFSLKGLAAYAYPAMALGYWDEEVNYFFYEGLFAIGEDWTMEQLQPVLMKVGEIQLKCMALLDQINTER